MFPYEIRKSLRAARVRITVKSDASVIITIPYHMSEKKGVAFAESRREWIEKARTTMQKRPKPLFTLPKGNARDCKKHKEEALLLIRSILERYNAIYRLSWKDVSIKNTSSRWGSCSAQGNLNFNYRILFLPKEHAEYIVVHELCHLREMNHSERFWKLVEKAIPDYKEQRKQLRGL